MIKVSSSPHDRGTGGPADWLTFSSVRFSEVTRV